MRHGHADGAFYLLHRGTEQRSVHSSRGDGTVHHVVDLVALEAEDLREPSPDFVQADHGTESRLPVNVTSHLCSSDDNWVEVVVTELASVVPWDARVESKDCPVGVPLAYGRRVRSDYLLRCTTSIGTEHLRALTVGVRQRFLSQNDWRIGFQSQCRGPTHDRVCVELFDALPHNVVHGLAVLAVDEILGILCNTQSLIRVSGKCDR
mmetsp:Transcript_19105/g.51078  ORF Transcript_19105/g.51078 Transcript_19105/m.51078 type:complete len:207 (-) Transcript_19105:152-772(-)